MKKSKSKTIQPKYKKGDKIWFVWGIKESVIKGKINDSPDSLEIKSHKKSWEYYYMINNDSYYVGESNIFTNKKKAVTYKNQLILAEISRLSTLLE